MPNLGKQRHCRMGAKEDEARRTDASFEDTISTFSFVRGSIIGLTISYATFIHVGAFTTWHMHIRRKRLLERQKQEWVLTIVLCIVSG
eukprot:SAG31_NODE_112_length_24420_cov_19.787550_16_plen_88_part_00